ncbi:MAG TPA: type II toxin-antitoxin system PemK/MazF family toxin [Spirochaetia bacterium]|nr:type II toxin-antitoxin system PemK/MazF family toxin [Spirochaetia bacterium]
MNRGELYLVKHPNSRDPKRQRVFVVVSRQAVIESRFATVVCAPVFTTRAGISTQVPVGTEEGLKHESAVHCDELISLPKSVLTHYIGVLSEAKTDELNEALRIALEIEE